MNEDVDFDFEDFRKKVWNEFDFLKSRKRIDELSSDEIKEELKKGLGGCFFIPFLGLMDRIGKKALEKEAKKRNRGEFEKEADDLLAHAEIREVICKPLREKSRDEILTEGKFFNIVVQTLAEKDVRKQFVIPLEPVLFAFVLFRISETGVENFCNQSKHTP